MIALDFNGVYPSLTKFSASPVRWHIATNLTEVLPTLEKVWSECELGFEAVGWISYEAASVFDAAFQCAPVMAANISTAGSPQPPLVVFAVLDASEASLPTHEAISFPPRRWNWKPPLNAHSYQKQLEIVQEAIRAGETYQVNLTHRLYSTFEGNPWDWYQSLCREQQAGYNAFIQYQDWSVLSCSPELFFEWNVNVGEPTGLVKAKPMKGTLARAPDAASDSMRANWLRNSIKNRAENVMIVDLLRNDLARIATHVEVPTLFELERYASVWQMTSTIHAHIKASTRWLDVLAALFPCGSVTGAPKLKTSEYIARMEGVPRGVYCGAVGWVSAQRAVFNVPIRTIQYHASGQAVYGVGNGLTIDSDPEEEWQEIQAKCRFLNRKTPSDWVLFETMYWSESTGFRYREEHLHRIIASAEYWGWVKPDGMAALKDQLRQALTDKSVEWVRSQAAQRVKLMLASNQAITIIAEPWTWKANTTPYSVIVASQPIPAEYDQRWLCHKTSFREIYDQLRLTKSDDIWDVILWNAKEELTEFTTGNIALELEGRWYTPPVSCGLLPGIARQKALESGYLNERVLMKKDLNQATRLAFINSLRGWVDVCLG
ncbi:MAG: chorismate-binding protein [Pseudomonadota bacterium]